MNFLSVNKGAPIFIFLSVGFALLVWLYAPNPRLTYDSYAYIEASKNIDTYFHGKNADGHSYLFRPPVIPAYLHFFEDKILAAKVLNTVCFVLSLWLCYFIGRQLKFEPIFLSLFVISVSVSYPWLQNHFFVWSEPLFGTLLLFLTCMMLTRSNWVWVAMLCVLLYFVRKAGLLIAAGVVSAYFLQQEYKKGARIAVVSFVVALCWEWISSLHSNGDTLQTIFEDSPTESKLNYLDVITAWFIPRNMPLSVRLLLLGSGISVTAALFREKFFDVVRVSEVKTVFAVMTIYILIFMVMWRLDYNETERYLSVMMPLAMLLVMVVLRALCSKHAAKKYWLLFFFLWMTYPIGRTLYHLL